MHEVINSVAGKLFYSEASGLEPDKELWIRGGDLGTESTKVPGGKGKWEGGIAGSADKYPARLSGSSFLFWLQAPVTGAC